MIDRRLSVAFFRPPHRILFLLAATCVRGHVHMKSNFFWIFETPSHFPLGPVCIFTQPPLLSFLKAFSCVDIICTCSHTSRSGMHFLCASQSEVSFGHEPCVRPTPTGRHIRNLGCRHFGCVQCGVAGCYQGFVNCFLRV